MLEGRERFAAFVAHELRTPLATQRALLELALADPHADLATWREIGEDVLGACRQQERLLEACLALARSEGGPQRCEPVDIAAIAGEALRAHDLSGLERVVVLEPAWAAGDPDLLERLAANLVSNAIRHNIVGGRIEVATRTESGRAYLSVANTGPLIPAGEAPASLPTLPTARTPSRRLRGRRRARPRHRASDRRRTRRHRHRTSPNRRRPRNRRRVPRSRLKGTEHACVAAVHSSSPPSSRLPRSRCSRPAAAAAARRGSRASPPPRPAATATTTTQNGLLAFSQCMRSHGVPNFPDPQRFAGGNVKLTIHQLASRSSRQP